jgi:hypothetical protein
MVIPGSVIVEEIVVGRDKGIETSVLALEPELTVALDTGLECSLSS